MHLPLALAVLTPALAALTLLAMRHGLLPARVWGAIVLLHAVMLGSGWVALETGEQEEERTEGFVAERHIADHEEAAERFVGVAGVALLIAAAGCLGGRAGRVARIATLAAGAALVAAAVVVGHSGGELVYRHGAAAAYTERPTVPPAAPTTRSPSQAGDADDWMSKCCVARSSTDP